MKWLWKKLFFRKREVDEEKEVVGKLAKSKSDLDTAVALQGSAAARSVVKADDATQAVEALLDRLERRRVQRNDNEAPNRR